VVSEWGGEERAEWGMSGGIEWNWGGTMSGHLQPYNGCNCSVSGTASPDIRFMSRRVDSTQEFQ
jgi:hypothetical protein